jgi:hypothetical protein
MAVGRQRQQSRGRHRAGWLTDGGGAGGEAESELRCAGERVAWAVRVEWRRRMRASAMRSGCERLQRRAAGCGQTEGQRSAAQPQRSAVSQPPASHRIAPPSSPICFLLLSSSLCSACACDRCLSVCLSVCLSLHSGGRWPARLGDLAGCCSEARHRTALHCTALHSRLEGFSSLRRLSSRRSCRCRHRGEGGEADEQSSAAQRREPLISSGRIRRDSPPPVHDGCAVAAPHATLESGRVESSGVAEWRQGRAGQGGVRREEGGRRVDARRMSGAALRCADPPSAAAAPQRAQREERSEAGRQAGRQSAGSRRTDGRRRSMGRRSELTAPG